MLPAYYEIQATVNAAKPIAGWKSNAYVIFDYQSEYDFKFAGINVSLDKIQMGHRTPEGWVVDVQTSVQAKPNWLIIMADDCTFSDLPLYGGENAKTPNIDRLAEQGLTFSRA